MGEDSELEETRKDILFKQKDRLQASSRRDLILTLGFVIGFLGPAAVLMPPLDSPTGMFTADLEIESPEIRRSVIRDGKWSQGELSFVFDSEVQNPNLVEAELEETSFRIKVDGETVKRGVKPWNEKISAKSSSMITYLFEINTQGLPEENSISSDSTVLLEGEMQLSSGGETFEVPFRRVIL